MAGAEKKYWEGVGGEPPVEKGQGSMTLRLTELLFL